MNAYYYVMNALLFLYLHTRHDFFQIGKLHCNVFLLIQAFLYNYRFKKGIFNKGHHSLKSNLMNYTMNYCSCDGIFFDLGNIYLVVLYNFC